MDKPTETEIKRIFLTLKEVSQLYGISYPTIHNHVCSGVLPAHKIGHLWRVHVDDLKTYGERVGLAVGRGEPVKQFKRRPKAETAKKA